MRSDPTPARHHTRTPDLTGEMEHFQHDTFIVRWKERNFNADAYVTFALDHDGSIATTFTFREGAFDGTEKVMRPRGFVREGTGNAVWGMQFVWPIKAEYLIAHVDEDYTETIIARSRLDYVWVMARTPQIPAEDFERLRRQVADLGYDVNKLQKVPQRW